jgi:choline dehydrogenase-like flavoprotein
MQAFAHSIGSTMIYPPESHFSDPAQLAADAGSLLQFSSITVTNHYSGTCNMGTDITNGVVSSSDLHVFGTKHLMVADNSIYPFPETGNTAWQAYVAGLMAAYFLGFQLP